MKPPSVEGMLGVLDEKGFFASEEALVMRLMIEYLCGSKEVSRREKKRIQRSLFEMYSRFLPLVLYDEPSDRMFKRWSEADAELIQLLNTTLDNHGLRDDWGERLERVVFEDYVRKAGYGEFLEQELPLWVKRRT